MTTQTTNGHETRQAKDVDLTAITLGDDAASIRRDFLHKASTDLIRRFDVIAIEDLQVTNMVRNHHLARAISCGQCEDTRDAAGAHCNRPVVARPPPDASGARRGDIATALLSRRPARRMHRRGKAWSTS